jgi:hypothetical protein
MQKITLAGLALMTILVFSSCYYDKADELYPPEYFTCDTILPVSYSQRIIPLFQLNCSPCHTQSSPDGGIILGIYANDKTIALNGKLYGSVNQSPGFFPMPKGKSKMTSCQIAVIKKWVDDGSPNN